MKKSIVLFLNFAVILLFVAILIVAVLKTNGECFGALAFLLMPLAMLCCTYITDYYTLK